MVNNGPSRACLACRQRRRKCDETRPTCLRCHRARRRCPGYSWLVNNDRKFVIYSGERDSNSLHQRSVSSLVHWPKGSPPDWLSFEQTARDVFFDDYCIVSSNRDLSRGYLHGLQTMIAEASSSSEITKACTIIALANLGKKAGNPEVLERAEELHILLLRSFRLSMSKTAAVISAELLITAALLGLYEVITSTNAYHGAHVAHGRGISAILNCEFSPFNLVCDGTLFRITHLLPLEGLEKEIPWLPHLEISSENNKNVKLSSRFSILCTPLFNQPKPVMDTIFAQTESLIQTARIILASEATIDQVSSLQRDAERLKEGYDKWPESLSQEWAPRLVGSIASRSDDITLHVGYWPGNVASYYDPYIASIWNSYRKASLMVLDVIGECRKRSKKTSLYDLTIDSIFNEEVQRLVDGIMSSIPFLLTADLQVFIDNTADTSPLTPGRSVGGLFLIHTLYVLSTMSMIDSKLKDYIRDCLIWIGDTMGIGQATILSKCTTTDLFDYVLEAHVVIWAGFLI